MSKVWIIIALVMIFLSSGGILFSNDVCAKSAPDHVNIGAILAFNSTIGKVAKIAIEAAVDDVNSDPTILNGTNLNISMQDTKLSIGFLGIIDSLLLMEKDTAAIIGPQYSVMAHVISHIANEMQVPLLSFAASDPTLTSLQFPYFVRTTQSDLYQMSAVADIVDHFQWRDVIAIFIDDDHGRNGVAALGDKLAEKRGKISHKAAFKPADYNNNVINKEEINSALIKVALMESRVIVLHIYPSFGLEVLHIAQSLGMMGSGYVWIVTDWLTTALDSDPSLLASSSIMNDMQGVITLRMFTPDSRIKSNFESRWPKLANNFGLNIFGLYAYDTVWTLAYALDEFFINGGTLKFSNDSILNTLRGDTLHLDTMGVFLNGSMLLQKILEVNRTGLTGRMVFSQDGSLMNPSYEIINVIGNGVRRIGFWSNSSGLHSGEQVPNHVNSSEGLYGVIWPGQTTQTPRGWVFSSNGRHLRIGVPLRVSYHEFVSRIEGSDMFGGYCIDVFTAALDLLPYPVPYKFIPFGDGKTNPLNSILLQKITIGEFDAVVGDITITTNRTKIVDFTQPYIESGLVVVAPIRKMKSNAWAFLRPFTPMMWLVTGMFFLAVGAVVWILERRLNDDFRGTPRETIGLASQPCFFAHRERTVSTLGRLVLIIWLFVVLILNSSYIASLTSILTVEQLSSSVKGIESLATSNERIGYLRGSFAENYLTDELNIHRSRLVPLNSPSEYEKALKDGAANGGVAAIIDERAYMELFLATRCEFGIVGQEFTKMGWGFAFPRDSPLAIDMSTAILKLSENGDLQRIHDKWLTRSACSSEGAKQGIDRLEIKSFWGLFLLIAIACFIALLCHVIKMAYRFKKHYSDNINNNLEGSSSHSSCIKSFFSFVNEREEDELEKMEDKNGKKRRRKDNRIVAHEVEVSPLHHSNVSIHVENGA